RRGRRIDVEQREVRLAVLADAEVQRLHAPVFVLGDLATEAFDDRSELLGHVFDLLRADVLARKIDVLIKRHEMPFLCWSVFWRQALRALRKGSIALKAETRDAGPSGPTGSCETAVRSASSQSTECAFYRVFSAERKFSSR